MASLRIFVVIAITIAATHAQTITTNKLSYSEGERIEISWDYPNSVAKDDDWIGVYFDGQLSGSNTLAAGSQMWVYIKTETQTSSKGKVPTGSVTFDANPPDESQGQTWPLSPGTYQAHIIRDVSSPYPTVANSAPFTVVSGPSPTTPPPTPTAPTVVNSPSVTLSKATFSEGEDIVVTFSYPGNPGTDAWISLWPAGSNPFALPSPSPYWNYICSDSQSSACGNHPTMGQVTLNSDSAGSWSWPLTCGSWQAFLIPDGSTSSFYASVASSVEFSVGSGVCNNPTCTDATSAVSNNDHVAPVDGLDITKVAFSSCYKPTSQLNSDLWQHVRGFCGSRCIWNWLGDNIYGDTNSQQTQRERYNAARNDQYYSAFGPVANPKIPTTGTWDDHDFGFNNEGENYECRLESQGEFVNHFSVPSTDPRHPDQGVNQQEGVYSAYMFKIPESSTDGVHLINLDARFHRSPTFTNYGPCAGANSRMISSEQWAWLTNELSRPSVVKIIGSGTQILPPTYRGRSLSSYCSYDGAGNTFDQANAEMGEGPSFEGTQYESWAEIPQERTRLLKLVQESINAGNTKHVIFISGDQHWAEIMYKRIPARSGQPEVTVFEVTASGIDQNWPYNVPNSNRFRPDSRRRQLTVGTAADTRGDGNYQRTCITDCADEGRNVEGLTCKWGTRRREWGVCLLETNAPVTAPAPAPTPGPSYPPGVTSATWASTNSDTNTCSGDVLHVCNKRANYGGIEVDWASNEVHLSIFAPHESTAERARVTLAL